MANEADTCRRHIVPKLQAAGWDTEPHSIAEQRTFTDGRIIPTTGGYKRRPTKRADYLLRYRPDFAIAVVEAKASYKSTGDGMQQAKEYAEILPLHIPLLSLNDRRRIVEQLDGLQAKVDQLKTLQAQTAAELDTLLASILDKAFKGEL